MMTKADELLAKKKIVLKPAAAPAPKALPLAEPLQEDDEKATLERPVPSSPANNEPTVEGDVSALAASTREPSKADGKAVRTIASAVPAPPSIAPVAPAAKPATSGVDKLLEGLKEKLIPEIVSLLQPIRQQLGELKAQLDGLSGKVDTHEEDMNGLNDEVEGKMSAGALQTAETALQELRTTVDKLEGALGKKVTESQVDGEAPTVEFTQLKDLGQLKAAFQVVAGDDYERVHGIAQDYQETTTILLVDYLRDLNKDDEASIGEFVDVLNRRGGDFSKQLMNTFLSVPNIVRAELARRKGFSLIEIDNPDAAETSERAVLAAGAKVEVDQETDKVLNNARHILEQMEQTEGES
jgi:hypothetical protein